jgi:integrase
MELVASVHERCTYPFTGDAMRIPKPFTVRYRDDRKTFQITLSHTCGLPEPVCAQWRRRSFQEFPDDLANYRKPKTKSGKPDFSAAEAGAVALIAYLKKPQQKITTRITVTDFAKDMFIEDAPHLKRWAAKGMVLKPHTVVQHRRDLIKYILPGFGHLHFEEITPTMVEDFLLDQRLSNSTRNTILYTFKLVMREARRSGVIGMIPEIEAFKRNSKRQNTLSGEELLTLFPGDETEFIKIWKRPDDMRKERPELALMFGTLFCVTASAGLRSGEARALFRDQVSIENSGLIIDRAIDEDGNIGLLKKATEEETRARAVVIPGMTMKILERWFERMPNCSSFPNLVFPYHEKPITGYYILDRFRYGLKNAGIDYESRRLTVHCLRYTYNTRMKTLLSAQLLREFLGHRAASMTDHYDNPILMERLTAHQSARPSVEKFWGEPKQQAVKTVR